MKALEFSTVQRTVNDLIPLSINPRKISEAKRMKMIESLQKFNLVDLPVVDSDNTVISGHQRLRALQAIGRGDEVIDVRMPNRKLTDKEVKEYNLLANTHFGEFDFEGLEADFGDVDFKGLGMEDLKMDFDAFVLGDLEDAEAKDADNTKSLPPQYEAQEDDFETPEVAEIKTDIVLGDLIEFKHPDGRYHRLLCGDSTKKEDVERLMDGEKADMVFTDPPYGVNIVNTNSSKVGGDGLTKFGKVGGGNYVEAKVYAEIIGDESTETALNFHKICIELGFENYIIWGGNYFTDFLTPSACWIIWDKKNTGNFADVEMAWTSFGKAAKLYSYLWNGMSREGSRDLELKSRVHPTQKPVGLFINIFNDFQFKSCYDGFGGSGSTMVASHKTERNCFMIEMSCNYCQVITDRMRKLDPSLIILKNGVKI